MLIRAYRIRGHFHAKLDPLGRGPSSHPLLDPAEFGFDEAKLDRPVAIPGFSGMDQGTPRQLLQALHDTYCRTFAVEFMEMRDKERRDWLLERMEPTRNRPTLETAERVRVLEQILAAERFEQFLHRRFLGKKRFSLEGGEALIPLMDTLIEDGAELGVGELVIAMAHRGRLNVLVHSIGMPYQPLMRDFETGLLPSQAQGSGDVKYHRGYSSDRVTRRGRGIHLSLCANPRHLEAINPVAEGIVRCKQELPRRLRADPGGAGAPPRRCLVRRPGRRPGDARPVGARGLRTGGTIHLIVNNQIGFTTSPEQFRCHPYPTDLAKAIQAPVFHVNGDDPEACVHAREARHRLPPAVPVKTSSSTWSATAATATTRATIRRSRSRGCTGRSSSHPSTPDHLRRALVAEAPSPDRHRRPRRQAAHEHDSEHRGRPVTASRPRRLAGRPWLA